MFLRIDNYYSQNHSECTNGKMIYNDFVFKNRFAAKCAIE